MPRRRRAPVLRCLKWPVWAFFLALLPFRPTISADRPLTGKPWLDMDYGPFLTFSIEAPQPNTNLTFKGIAINLGRAAGSAEQESIIFDTDLLRYSAGWTGNFLHLSSVVFDGAHWAYPKIDGQQAFGNPAIPGWAKAGSFRDPREFIYGPLPRDWAHWKGLHLHGNQVILHYTVGQTAVLELPGLEKADGLSAFVRTLNIGRSTEDMLLQLAFVEGSPATILGMQDLAAKPADAPAATTIAVLGELLPPTPATTQRPLEITNGLAAQWRFEEVAEGVAADRIANRRMQLAKAQPATGRAGAKAVEFKGDGSGLIGPVADWEFLQTDLTFAAWIYARGDGSLLAHAPAEGAWVRDGKTWFIRNGRLCFDVGWVGSVETSARVPQKQWAHVAMTWNRQEGRVRLFINGRESGNGILKPRQPTPQLVWKVGHTAANFPGKPHLDGLLEELRVYRRTLDAAEIQALAGGVAPPENRVLAAGLVGAPAAAKWQATPEGHLRLSLPASATSAKFKVLLASVGPTSMANFARLVQQSTAPADLSTLTNGGPARWSETLVTQGKRGAGDGPFQVDQLTWPEKNPWHSWMRFAGFDFFSDPTKAAICTWSGDVWLVAGLDDTLDKITWRRFATGLYEPGGLKVVNDRVYVLARDQITRLHDRNGDGEADWYENFNNDTMNAEHFHEFVYDLQTDASGDFYYLKGSRHARDAQHPHHGTFLKVSKDGSRTEILAKGFRAPNGLGLGPNGQFFTTDQEGYWMPQNRLNLIQPGRFYGNIWSWFPEGKPKTNDPPMVWVHRDVDRSPSTMIWADSPQWAPLQDKLLSLSYGVGKIFLVMMETIEGREQGGMTELPLEFDTGIMRARFGPRGGPLYVCGLFGWAGNKTRDGGFYRIRRTAQPLRMPDELHIAADGVVLHFTTPLDAASAGDPANYHVQVFNYKWTENYGSPDFKLNGERGRDTLPVKSALLSQDGRTLFLELPGIAPVMQMHIQMNVQTADGRPLQTYVHNTIHRLGGRKGLDWLGGQPTVVARKEEVKLAAETPGLVQRIARGNTAETRIARLVALHVPAGEIPSPTLTPGAFQSEWTGYIKLDLSDEYTFHATGAGNVSLSINGFQVARDTALKGADVTFPAIRLRGGLNRIQVSYRSPAKGAATLRLGWSAAQLAPEPVPPAVFVHEGADAELQAALRWREGRSLFGALHCVKCHQPATPLPAAAMPELTAEAPALDISGSQFEPGWVVAWLKNPHGAMPEALMPSVLDANPEQAGQQAADLAAFLATLKATNAPPPITAAVLDTAPNISLGADRFSKLGCVACHVLPGDKLLEGDTRRSLAHVKAKWQPAALVEFLRQPEKHWPWTRMPNFQLTAQEAAALAGYVRSRGDTPAGAAAPGDRARGKKLAGTLGCANCHTIPGVTKRADYPGLDAMLRALAAQGCLATDAAGRKSAPVFPLTAAQRAALTEFRAGGRRTETALRQDEPVDFAARHFTNLRCGACHEREDAKDFWFKLESQNVPAAAAKPVDEEEAGLQEKTIHAQRPPLTWAGEKLRPEWLEQFLAGKVSYKPRRKMEARMPAFPAYARGLAAGLALSHGMEPVSPPPAPADARLAAVGQALAQKGALSCVDCHDTGKSLALAGGDTATINFAHIPDRLQKSYYDRYLRDPQRLLPGTMMPKFITDDGTTGVRAHFDGDARRQFDALWHYMRALSAAE